ncbi:HCNGP-like protein-domain-containing protein [Entophlyctis helioformis]|nr:HCNGP-like protein-domain-containing protein [Entophlyctis helioformis]
MQRSLVAYYGSDSDAEASGDSDREPSPKAAANGTAASSKPPAATAATAAAGTVAGLVRLNKAQPSSAAASSASSTPIESRAATASPALRPAPHVQHQHQSHPPPASQPSSSSSPSLLIQDDEQDQTRLARMRQILLSQGYLAPDYASHFPPEPLAATASTATSTSTPTPASLADRLGRFRDLRSRGVYLNDRLVHTHAFRNPAIMSKLIEYLQLDEAGSNFPKATFDPAGLPAEAFYDELAKAQENKPIDAFAQHVQAQMAGVQSVGAGAGAGAGGIAGPPNVMAAVELAKERARRFMPAATGPAATDDQGDRKRPKNRWDQMK